MKTISARQFRLNFQELTEPVQVQRRRASGEYEIVGTWSPKFEPPPSAREMVAGLPANLAVVEKFGFHPVPKPGKR